MEHMTPEQIRNRKGQFSVKLRGYDTAEVDEFIDEAAKTVEELEDRLRRMRQRAEEAEAGQGSGVAVTSMADGSTDTAAVEAELEEMRRQAEAECARMISDQQENLKTQARIAGKKLEEELQNRREAAQLEINEAIEAANRATSVPAPVSVPEPVMEDLADGNGEEMEVPAPPPAPVVDDGAARRQLDEDAGKILRLAQRTADAVIQEARDEAETLTADAQAQADEILANAQNEADTQFADLRTKTEEMLKEANSEADGIVGKARNTAKDQLDEAEKIASEIIREAETKRSEIESTFKPLLSARKDMEKSNAALEKSMDALREYVQNLKENVRADILALAERVPDVEDVDTSDAPAVEFEELPEEIVSLDSDVEPVEEVEQEVEDDSEDEIAADEVSDTVEDFNEELGTSLPLDLEDLEEDDDSADEDDVTNPVDIAPPEEFEWKSPDTEPEWLAGGK